jgi:hypothetical protein
LNASQKSPPWPLRQAQGRLLRQSFGFAQDVAQGRLSGSDVYQQATVNDNNHQTCGGCHPSKEDVPPARVHCRRAGIMNSLFSRPLKRTFRRATTVARPVGVKPMILVSWLHHRSRGMMCSMCI